MMAFKSIRPKNATKSSAVPKLQPQLLESKEPMNRKQHDHWKTRENSIIEEERQKLIKEGLKDKEIARKLTEKLPGRTLFSIYIQIRLLIKNNYLPENPNKQLMSAFTNEEKNIIILERQRLIKEGFNDRAISIKLTEKFPGRKFISIDAQIRRLIKQNHLPENPNKLLDFTDKEKEIIASERQTLIKEGLNDRAISIKLTEKFPGRKFISIYTQIRLLIKQNHLPENPNKQLMSAFTNEEKKILISERQKLIKKGFTDWAISIKLTEKLPGRKAKSICSQIIRFVKNNQMPGNPNKKASFTDKENSILISERQRLIKKGFKDKEIARKLTEQLPRRTAESIYQQIRLLIKNNHLPENPNKRTTTSAEDLKSQIEEVLSRIQS